MLPDFFSISEISINYYLQFCVMLDWFLFLIERHHFVYNFLCFFSLSRISNLCHSALPVLMFVAAWRIVCGLRVGKQPTRATHTPPTMSLSATSKESATICSNRGIFSVCSSNVWCVWVLIINQGSRNISRWRTAQDQDTKSFWDEGMGSGFSHLRLTRRSGGVSEWVLGQIPSTDKIWCILTPPPLKCGC